MIFVMLVEIPDPEVILSVIIAFLVGLGGLFAYYRLSPMIRSDEASNTSQKELLEYYERQLIDMKIRLDSLEIQGVEEKPQDPNLELKQFLEKLAKNQVIVKSETITKPEKSSKELQIPTRMPNLDQNNATDYVLRLITDKAMTSRDIQITLKRSREHTSRLMKKLFEDGFVERDTSSKPYTYNISEKGKQRLGIIETSPTTV